MLSLRTFKLTATLSPLDYISSSNADNCHLLNVAFTVRMAACMKKKMIHY